MVDECFFDLRQVTGDSTTSDTGDVAPLKGLTKAQKRSERMKSARPELASQIPDRLSIDKAVKIGGYKDKKDFLNDMERRMRSQAKDAQKR